jgi:prophage regulatory protein
MNSIDDLRFLRLRDIIGRRGKSPLPGLLPISASSWWAGVASGKYPPPVKLGPKTTAWRESDIRDLLTRLSGESVGAPG